MQHTHKYIYIWIYMHIRTYAEVFKLCICKLRFRLWLQLTTSISVCLCICSHCRCAVLHATRIDRIVTMSIVKSICMFIASKATGVKRLFWWSTTILNTTVYIWYMYVCIIVHFQRIINGVILEIIYLVAYWHNTQFGEREIVMLKIFAFMSFLMVFYTWL